jgi:hypothetical protein
MGQVQKFRGLVHREGSFLGEGVLAVLRSEPLENLERLQNYLINFVKF